ncbi:hypothetical protein EYC80_005578 [Monilinia laxa]|uniref:Uncharacterized protein n=1 Tax=Monilinia laxa TaxID=61186 RepID=A0A5N6KEB7_MONLA|nr:hypothetical protein EYC80_005578 [Monilinia laxa]
MSSSISVSGKPPAKTPPVEEKVHWKRYFFTQCQNLTDEEDPKCVPQKFMTRDVLEPKGGLWDLYPETRGKGFDELGLRAVFNKELRKEMKARKEAQKPVSERAPSEESHDRNSQETVRPERVAALLNVDDLEDRKWGIVGLIKK